MRYQIKAWRRKYKEDKRADKEYLLADVEDLSVAAALYAALVATMGTSSKLPSMWYNWQLIDTQDPLGIGGLDTIIAMANPQAHYE